MLSAIHFLLTYTCTWACDHCFVFGSPSAGGTFTAASLREAFAQIAQVPAIDTVYFEGGEPFLYYALMLEGLRMARDAGLSAGIVTNSYWATTEEDAALWLAPIAGIGCDQLSVSADCYHGERSSAVLAGNARAAAERLGIDCGTMGQEAPAVVQDAEGLTLTGSVMFRGRAADRLTADLPRQPWRSFSSCPHEDLRDPSRVHLDAFGNLHACQGLIMGNIWERPLSDVVACYRPDEHPIAGPLLRGGPAALAVETGVAVEEGYVDACHLCFSVRRALLERYPAQLRPRSVYFEST
jgi:hypothetical protein